MPAAEMEPRLTSAILVSALLRRAEAEGGFGAVLAKGDETSGSIIVIFLEKGGNPRIFERVLQAGGPIMLGPIGDLPRAKLRKRFPISSPAGGYSTPIYWFIELDVPSSERFADEMNSIG